ncbi:MAG TPA: hypothetical protein VIU62_12385 [Chloroflexota bacterium]
MLQRMHLRWLTAGITLGAVSALFALAAVNRSLAPVALAAALVMALKGTAWLLVLRRNRMLLLRNGYRW